MEEEQKLEISEESLSYSVSEEDRRDISSRSSRYSDNEDDSLFEPDLDYEPEDDNDDDRKIENEILAKLPSGDHPDETSFENIETDESYLYSDDDDIEVIDVISSETGSPKKSKGHESEKVKENMKSTKISENKKESPIRTVKYQEKLKRSVSPKRKHGGRNVERKGSSSMDRSRIQHANSLESMKIIRVSSSEVTTKEYTREDLEKVKAYFTGARNKRKSIPGEFPRNSSSAAKKFKGKDGRAWRDFDEVRLKERLEREGKVFIQNYIPFPASKKSDFKRDIKSAFRDELNEDILITLTPSYCGLCFKDFDDDIVAWKHYTGSNHKSTIKRFNRGCYKGHPPYWRMVHERLCDKATNSLTEREIFNQVCDHYNVGDNIEKVKSLVKKSIDCLVYYDLIGFKNDAYYVKNKNVQDVRKIFENYYYEKKKTEEIVEDRRNNSRTVREYVPTRREHDNRSSNSRRRSEFVSRPSSRSLYTEDRRDVPSRHSTSGFSASSRAGFSYGQVGLAPDVRGRTSSNQMLVVDPSKLKMLPNGQIMIKPDDVMSVRPREAV